MGETRVDLLHLLEDLRDAYPGSVEETILTEIVANSLDSGATSIKLMIDAARATLAAAGHHGFTGYAPLNVVGEVASLATLAGYVREAGAARGLSVRIDGLAADGAAGDGADAPAFTLTSGLDALPFRYERTLRDSLGEVLDHFLSLDGKAVTAASPNTSRVAP